MLILQGPTHQVESLTFSPDTTTLYAGQGPLGIRAWNITDRTATRAEFDGRLLIGQIAFHPDGRWAFGSTAHTRLPYYERSQLIDLSTGTMQSFNCAEEVLNCIAMFPGNSRIITIGHRYANIPSEATSSTQLYSWTLKPTGPECIWHREIPLGHTIRDVVSIGDPFATSDQTWIPATGNSSPMRVTIRNADNGEPETELTGLHERFDQLLASPSGNWLVARTGTKLHVWDANDWNRPPRIVAGKHKHTMRFPLAAFHPSGRYLLLADNTSSIIAFDTTTWNEARKWNWNAGSLHAVAVSSDGTLAAAGGLRGAVVVWDWDL